MAQVTFSPQFVDEITRDESRSKEHQDAIAALSQRVHFFLLPTLVSFIALAIWPLTHAFAQWNYPSTKKKR